jgi:hypothetical protein
VNMRNGKGQLLRATSLSHRDPQWPLNVDSSRPARANRGGSASAAAHSEPQWPATRSPSRARVSSIFVRRDQATPFLGRRTRLIPTRSAIREARCATGLIALG